MHLHPEQERRTKPVRYSNQPYSGILKLSKKDRNFDAGGLQQFELLCGAERSVVKEKLVSIIVSEKGPSMGANMRKGNIEVVPPNLLNLHDRVEGGRRHVPVLMESCSMCTTFSHPVPIA
jgi:hypothetical protein